MEMQSGGSAERLDGAAGLERRACRSGDPHQTKKAPRTLHRQDPGRSLERECYFAVILKWARRFRCQQSSSLSVHCGRSFP